MRKIAVLLSALVAGGCSDSLDDQSERLNKFVQANKYGNSADVWLVKQNVFGQLERVSLVFGFLDDYTFCSEVAELYMQRYPTDRYSCMLAN